MNKKSYKHIFLPAIISVAANLLLLLIYFLNTYVLEIEALVYSLHFLSEIISTALAVVIACALSVIYKQRRPADAFLLAILYAFINLISLLPQLLGGIQTLYTADDMLWILLEALLGVAVLYAEYLLLFLLMIFIQKKIAKGEENLDSTLENPFDFSNAAVLSVFSASAALSLYNFVREVIDTIDYFTRYFGSYRIEEIIYISASYLVILASLFVAHILGLFTMSKIKENRPVEK